MVRRVGRPGLIGTMARTAVVAGTASAVVGASGRRQQKKAQEQADQQAAAAESQQQLADMQAQVDAMQAQQAQQAAPAAPPAAPAAGGGDTMAELERLAQLKSSGVLSDEEFAAAKAKILGL